MLNKKLIAGSIFALMSAPALAVPSFTYTADSVSNQGAASLGMLPLNAVTITSGAEYSDDDLIVLDYNVALGSSYVPASTLSMYAKCVDGAAATITGTAVENGGELTLGLLSTDAAAGSITYRVTDVSYAVTTAGGGVAGDCATTLNSSVGAVLEVSGVKVDGAAALAAGSVTGTYHATLPNGSTDIDGGSASMTFALGTTPETYAKLATYGDQYSDAAGNTLLSGTIDVAAADPRSKFDDPQSTATGVVTLADNTALTANANITGITFSLNGDFSYLVDEDATTVGIQNDAWSLDLLIDTGGTDEVYEATTVTASKITWVVTEEAVSADALDVIDNIAIDFDNADNGDGKQAMVDGAYTYDVTLTYTDAGPLGDDANAVAGSVALTAGGAAGEFGLNGSTTTIKNYPLSSAVTQFVWVTNKGSQDGGIFATAFGGTDGQTMASCDLGVTSKAGEIQRITDELNACLAAASMTAGRAQIVVTVNAISTDIGVYAGYKHDADADRLNLTQ